MTNTPKTLSDFRLRVMKLDCYDCDRHGKYGLDGLIERYGPGATIRDTIRNLAQCDRPGSCKAGCDDLIYMWEAAPFSKERGE